MLRYYDGAFQFQFRAPSAEDSLNFYSMEAERKLKKATKQTDWTPAPEDVQA